MRRHVVGLVLLSAALGGCAIGSGLRARLVRAPNPCVDQVVQVYFEPDVAELTPEGRAVIDAAAAGARACKVKAVDVLGLADAPGTPAANLELSRRRAAAVSAALAGDGLPPANFRVGAAGAAGALAPNGAAAPLRRRVDVTLRLARR